MSLRPVPPPCRRLFRWLVAMSLTLLSACSGTRMLGPSADASAVFTDPRVAELAIAAASGETDRVKALARSGIPLNARGNRQVTLLQWALFSRSERGMLALLEAGADPAQPGIDGDTVIHLAAMATDPVHLRLLLAQGADPNVRASITGATPLASALRGGRGAQFADLLAAGADPNAADRDGNTLLHQAAKYNDAARVLALLKAGAHPTATNAQHVTFQPFLFRTREEILSVEARRGREAVREWLRAHDIPVQEAGTR